MRYLSVCAGIEAASAAWHPLGWEAAAFAEIEPFPNAVLAHRFPNVPNLGDFTQIGADDLGTVDLLVGGTPCQDFSVAGLRAGLAGERGALTIEFVRLLERVRPRWMVWENVPGVLSSDGGRAFGTFLGLLGQLGYGFAYRVLDAQYFGVPQRRRRVFVVGYLGDWRPSCAVLFERESLSGHPAPSREAGTRVAALTANGLGGGGPDDNLAQGGHLVPTLPLVTHALTDPTGRGTVTEDGTGRGTPLIAFSNTAGDTMLSTDEHTAPPITNRHGDPGCIAFTCKDDGRDAGSIAPTLRSLAHDASNANGGGQVAVAFATEQEPKWSEELALTLKVPSVSGGGQPQCVAASSVRRLTPREAERLQGFSDDWTLVPYRGKPAADGPRYRALGNSMCVNVMAWLGARIALVEAVL